MTNHTQEDVKKLYYKIDPEGCLHRPKQDNLYQCIDCGFEVKWLGVSYHNPNLLNPQAGDMLWMIEKALEQGLKIAFSLLNSKQVLCNMYKSPIIKEDNRSEGVADTPPFALLYALYDFFKIKGGGENE